MKAFIRRKWIFYQDDPEPDFLLLERCVDTAGARKRRAEGHFLHAGYLAQLYGRKAYTMFSRILDQPADVTHNRNPYIAQAVVPEPTQDQSPASQREEQPESPVEILEHVAPTTQNNTSNPLGQGSPADDAEPPTSIKASQPPAFINISFWRFEQDK